MDRQPDQTSCPTPTSGTKSGERHSSSRRKRSASGPQIHRTQRRTPAIRKRLIFISHQIPPAPGKGTPVMTIVGKPGDRILAETR